MCGGFPLFLTPGFAPVFWDQTGEEDGWNEKRTDGVVGRGILHSSVSFFYGVMESVSGSIKFRIFFYLTSSYGLPTQTRLKLKILLLLEGILYYIASPSVTKL